MKKKILVLGAGLLQILAIKTAKIMGLTVISIDQNPEAPGAKLCDIFEPVNFIDKTASLEVAKKYQIDGVLAISSDLPVPTLGFICDQLNLTGISEQTGEVCANKLLMRQCFADHGVPSPHFAEAVTLEEAEKVSARMNFPLMVKAVDTSGSRGVIKISQFSELEDAFLSAQNASRCNKVCIEEFMTGVEFGAQAVVHQGKVKLILPHNDTVSDPPYYVPVGHSFPLSQENFDLNNVYHVCQDGINALGIENAGVNLDLTYTDEGTKIIEIGARLGGTCLPELVTLHTGMDIVEQVIRIALDETPDLTIKKKDAVAALLIQSNVEGRLIEYQYSESLTETPGLLDLSFDLLPGDHVPFFKSGPDRIGQIIVKDETPQKAEEKAIRVNDNIKIVLDEI